MNVFSVSFGSSRFKSLDDKIFKSKGKKSKERSKILNDAKLLESAGVFSIVLECVKTSLARLITKEINIPTIGIGASKYCDGQILVSDDLIGLNPMNAKFIKKYANIRKEITKARTNGPSYRRNGRHGSSGPTATRGG